MIPEIGNPAIQMQSGVYPFFELWRCSSKNDKKKCDILLTVFGRIPIAQKNNQKECRAVNGTKIALKAKVQLANFMGKVFTHFSKPTRRFIEECIYGIQASGDHL
jgi:hypothetical protein